MISKYFTIEELIASQTAARKRIDNSPTLEHLGNLKRTAMRADIVRDMLGHPMIVSSGYRCAALNVAVGGSKTSSHTQGHAIDFTCPGFGTARQVFDALKKSGIKFDQLILEYPESPGAWVHIGFAEPMRNQHLVYDGQYRVA